MIFGILIDIVVGIVLVVLGWLLLVAKSTQPLVEFCRGLLVVSEYVRQPYSNRFHYDQWELRRFQNT